MTIYSVQAGNTLSGIAKANNMSLKQLLDLNPELKSNPDLIKVGQKIKLNKDTSIFPSRKNSVQQKSQTQQPQAKQSKVQKNQTSQNQTKTQAAQTSKKQEKPLSVFGGKYYVGMTKEEAKKKDLYSHWYADQDFKSMDKNKDGVLSEKEVLAAREKEASYLEGFATLSICSTFGLTTGVVYDDFDKAKNIRQENAQYRKQHNIKD